MLKLYASEKGEVQGREKDQIIPAHDDAGFRWWGYCPPSYY